MDSALKQRLLGAAVLIALAIIFVPMFFSSTPPKPENSTQNLNIPPAPERNFQTRSLPVDTSNGATPTPNPAAGGSLHTLPPTAAPLVDASADKPVVTPLPSTKPVAPAPLPAPVAVKPDTTPAAKPPSPPPTQADGRFLVNLGIYSDAGHANALVERVKKLGYPAFAESTDYQGKTAQRVRVGPYADRAAAENVRLKIKQTEDKVPSSVVQTAEAESPAAAPAVAPARPAAAAATAPAAPASASPSLPANRAGAYSVQVGAFKSEEEANKLRDRLRNGSLAAYIDKSSDGEQTLWKVRVGPFADKTSADATVATLKQKFQLPGIVKTQP